LTKLQLTSHHESREKEQTCASKINTLCPSLYFIFDVHVCCFSHVIRDDCVAEQF